MAERAPKLPDPPTCIGIGAADAADAAAAVIAVAACAAVGSIRAAVAAGVASGEAPRTTACPAALEAALINEGRDWTCIGGGVAAARCTASATSCARSAFRSIGARQQEGQLNAPAEAAQLCSYAAQLGCAA